jgi:hypothetical protein
MSWMPPSSMCDEILVGAARRAVDPEREKSEGVSELAKAHRGRVVEPPPTGLEHVLASPGGIPGDREPRREGIVEVVLDDVV